MKKTITSLFVVLLALMVSVNVTAQVRKTWDFTKLSQETIDNMIADTDHWSSEGTNEDGSHKGFTSKGKLSGELQANGKVIPEVAHLKFGTAGLKGGDYIFRPTQFRMTRDGMEVNFPKLAPGQTLTIRARSANKDATDRGFVSANDNLEYISGPKGGTCLGANAAGYGSADYPVEDDGNYTLVWKVREDLGTDSLDVKIKLSPKGGLDIALFMIDKGDEVVELPTKIAYLYDSSKESYDVEADPIFAALNGSDDTVEPIDIKEFTSADTDTINALESNYDLVVVSETPGSTHKFASSLKGMINRVPMLNMKSFFYKSSAWDWGAGVNFDIAPYSITLTEAGEAHEVFGNLGGAGDEIELYDPADYTGNIIQGYTVTEGSAIASDDVLATVGGGTFAIHEHGKTNKYMLFPYSADAAVAGVGLTDDGMDLLLAIVDYLADTKTKVRPAGKPTISLEYGNALTTVTIKGIEGATIYYTLDGTEPTTSSLVYTEPLQLTADAVVKAFVVCQGYNDSDVASAEVVVKSQAATPVITVTDNADGTKTVTMSGADGTTIHYNLCEVAPTSASPVYTEPIVVTRSADISAVAVGENMLDSEVALAVAEIAAYPFRKNELALVTFDESFNQVYVDTAGVEQTVAVNSKKYLWGEKKGWSYYYANGDSSVVNTDTRISTFGNGWAIESSGQALYYHGDGSSTVGGGYGPATTADAGFTKGGLQYAAPKSGDPYSGYLKSVDDNKFAGPFDVAVWLCAGNDPSEGRVERLEICSSTDGQTWTLIDTVSVVVDKMVHKVVAHYDGSESVYLRIGYAGGYKNKIMMMQLQVLGVGGTSDIELPVSDTVAEVVAVQIYNAAGTQLNQLGKGLNIVRKLHADGTVKVLKVMGK